MNSAKCEGLQERRLTLNGRNRADKSRTHGGHSKCQYVCTSGHGRQLIVIFLVESARAPNRSVTENWNTFTPGELVELICRMEA